jgi:hypothetical protein
MKLGSTAGAWLAAMVVFSTAGAEEFRFKEKFVAQMPGRVREFLRCYDRATGHFDGKIWECRHQICVYPLAVAYVTPGQRCYKDPKLLAVIVKAGDALIEAMAADFLRKIVAAQSEGGYWKEGGGPLILYNFDYIEALGHYYGMSHDRRVLPALENAAAYHAHFTYPDGKGVETIDQRNPFHADVALGNVGFSFSPLGRAWLQQQWAKAPQVARAADLMAAMVHHGEEGPMAPLPAGNTFILRDGGEPRAAVIRRDGWFLAPSAFTMPVSKNRWHQDRQNLVSIWHDKTGLILRGGNTKLQPAWSNFTVGDAGLLVHQPGDTRPNFIPPAGLFHVPSDARLVEGPEPGLDLTYGPEQCRLRIRWINPRKIAYRVKTTLTSGLPVAAHLTLLPQLAEGIADYYGLGGK